MLDNDNASTAEFFFVTSGKILPMMVEGHFNPGLFNPGLFNHELSNPGLYNPILFNHELFNPRFLNS